MPSQAKSSKPSRSDATPIQTNEERLNLVVLTGTVRTDPVTTDLDDGTIRLTFDLIAGPGTNAVPITWNGRVSSAPRIASGKIVSIAGIVRRHFYRSNGTLRSRTDVLASRVAVTPAKRRMLIDETLGSAQAISEGSVV